MAGAHRPRRDEHVEQARRGRRRLGDKGEIVRAVGGDRRWDHLVEERFENNLRGVAAGAEQASERFAVGPARRSPSDRDRIHREALTGVRQDEIGELRVVGEHRRDGIARARCPRRSAQRAGPAAVLLSVRLRAHHLPFRIADRAARVAAIMHTARPSSRSDNCRVPEFAPLREQDVDRDPLRQFTAWYQDAHASGLREPAAVAVATSTPDGVPSVRMVLLKGFDERGFVFFTNYESRKGRELEADPRAAMLFYWDPLGRQVRIEGPVARRSAEASAEYVRSRARGSQLSALASPQSQEVPDREWLEQRVSELAEQFRDAELPLPRAWGGFRLAPARYEFWRHRDDRLHDRVVYTPGDGGGWALKRLAP